jgi:ferredoxin/flavodoxin
MQGIICYYSGSGNTRLVCQAIAQRMPSLAFDLYDITQAERRDWGVYDVWGFATFADFFDPPQAFQAFIQSLPPQPGKWAFVLNTYGALNGKTLVHLGELVTAQGFRVLAGHALHTPESYPPSIVRGWANVHAPNTRELRAFERFVAELQGSLAALQAGQGVQPSPLPIGFLDRLIPTRPRATARQQMGDKYVDEAACTACGVCAKGCPYSAITLRPKPVFDAAKCYGCWACYNHCPHQAIYTAKLHGVGHYSKPLAELKRKLGV